ncbi:phosphohydrolase [Hahella sp. CCB-MM4]|uniref:HD-GYP domain-containing protein n=1 Tax=Hahella sp. (strain CCB-MM4) TaxID=1926491 RepID=UPI000B9B4059|nr:HD-GYP domain-containing protein [Hahella sp. CCB-MM4]OZG74697.1 phosphohydrolase [Hahella sp. CCB-MM4]
MAESKELQISVQELELGMHVVRLDREWIETDFLMQGFVITSWDDIEALQRQCEYVFVEAKIVNSPPPPPPATRERRREKQGLFARVTRRKTEYASSPSSSASRKPIGTASPPPTQHKVAYINKINVQSELPKAENTYTSAKGTVKSILNGIRLGRMIDMNQARETVNTVVDSVLRNKDALAWLTKIKEKDDYTAEHSLNVCILATTFARHLGHDESDIRKIALSGLLHDVGKSRIPDDILNKEGRFTDEEFQIMKMHTTYGRDLLMTMTSEDRIAIDVAHSHHERVDGRGYPRQLKEHQIPYFAKIVALADCYDAITSHRCYDSGRASMEALDIIYKCRGSQFDEELALEFIKCIGIYPPGSIVQMSNGEVAIVLATDENNKLKPKVLMVLDAQKQTCRERVVDLNRNALDRNEQPYAIAHELANGSYGVDLREYLNKGLVLKGANDDELLTDM